MCITTKFLEEYSIRYEININDNKIIINENINHTNSCAINNLTSLPKGLFDNCIINGELWLDHLQFLPNDFMQNSVINGLFRLDTLRTIHNNFLKNTFINGYICLNSLEYLPKGFRPNVKGEIHLDNLKSEILKNLILYPGINRQLGFNLLN